MQGKCPGAGQDRSRKRAALQITKREYSCHNKTTPDFIEVAYLISGIITDRGGNVSHAAILAKGFNIPCVVGCQTATTTIRDGDLIRLDATAGVVLGVVHDFTRKHTTPIFQDKGSNLLNAIEAQANWPGLLSHTGIGARSCNPYWVQPRIILIKVHLNLS